MFERDWQMPGDGLLTYDDVSRREWLDLSVSRLNQFPEPQLENAIAEIMPGGLFEGFNLASRSDVLALAESGGVDTSTSNLAVNQIAMSELIELLGSTFARDTPVFIRRSVGFIDEVDTNPPMAHQMGVVLRVIAIPYSDAGTAGLYFSSSDDSLFQGSTGLMLYRVVPEPSTLMQLLMAGCGIMPIRSRIHWRTK